MKYYLRKSVDPRDNKPCFWLTREYDSGYQETAYFSRNDFLSENGAIAYFKHYGHRFMFQDNSSLPIELNDLEVTASW